jgi:hypothetical protein
MFTYISLVAKDKNFEWWLQYGGIEVRGGTLLQLMSLCCNTRSINANHTKAGLLKKTRIISNYIHMTY